MYIFSSTHKLIEELYLIKNNPFTMLKRTFKFLSYFEKMFLVLFYKRGWFEKSLAYLYRRKDVEEYRRKHYPLINLFHLYLDKSDYKFEDLKLISSQFNFFYKSSLFHNKIKKISQLCFTRNNSIFLNFLIIQNIFFKKYFNTFSSFFFKVYHTYNTLTLNFIFQVFLLRSNKKLVIYDLNNWNDWYNFSFNNKSKKLKKYNINDNIYEKIKIKKKRSLEFKKILYKFGKYKLRFMIFSRLLGQNFVNLFMFRYNPSNVFKLKVGEYFKILLKNYYTIKFSESSVTKHINADNLKNYNIFYLRKNRIFNKGRYSRNRQLYRTGVYWCLWLNIIMVYGLYFIFYRFSFNFGYIWWGVLILAYSTIFSRIVKYNFFNPFFVYKEFNSLQRWYGYIIKNSMHSFENYMKNYFITSNLFNFLFKYKNVSFSYILSKYYYYFAKIFFYWLKKKENTKIVYLWQGMKEIDKSFLRYKTVIHWFKEIYRMFTTW